MKHSLQKKKSTLLAALFALLTVPSVHAITAAQMIQLGGCGLELPYGSFNQLSNLMTGYGEKLKITASALGSDYIRFEGLFHGLANPHFRVIETSATSARIELYNNVNGSPYRQSCASNNSKFAMIGVTPANTYTNDYAGYTTLTGYVTYDPAKQAFQIDFQKPLVVEGYNQATSFSNPTYQEWHTLYTLLFFQPNATVTDTKYYNTDFLGTYSSTVKKENRSYGIQILQNDDNTFTLTNWGGAGLAINKNGQLYRLSGYFDFDENMMYINPYQYWMQDISEMSTTSTKKYNYILAWIPESSLTTPISNGNVYTNPNYTIDGEMTVDHTNTRHATADMWAAPHGELKTVMGSVDVDFECYAPFDNDDSYDLGIYHGFRVGNTKIHIDELDVTLKVDLANSRLTIQDVRSADPSQAWMQAEIAFSAKNEMFVNSYKVYLVEGDIKTGTRKLLTTITKGNKDQNGYYNVDASITVSTPDGKPWSTWQGKTVNIERHILVVADYDTPTSAPANGQRMATAMGSSHHGLGTASVSVSVGVDGIQNEGDVSVAATQGGLMVTAPADSEVNVYNMAGIVVAAGKANTEIALDRKGMFIVKVGNKAFKLMK